MKSISYGLRAGVSLIVIFMMTLGTSSCSLLPEQDRVEVERLFRELTAPLIEAAKRWASEQWAKLVASVERWVSEQVEQWVEDLKRKLEEAWADLFPEDGDVLGDQAPEGVGVVAFGIDTETDKVDIRIAFQHAYTEAGGEKAIGEPDDMVMYWDRAGSKLLVQRFTGGSQKRSAIVLMDGADEPEAYVLPGLWLAMYENLGGPTQAGHPTSNPETWNINPIVEFWTTWGRGKRQMFWALGGAYALMQPSGLDAVFVVPPDLWSHYQTAADKIGYPLSSYPLDDTRWRKETAISAETRAILNEWEDQPFRIQVFENGSLMWLDGRGAIETVEYGKVAKFLDLGEVSLLLGVRRELGRVWEDEFTSGDMDTCFANTIRHGANIAADISTDRLSTQLELAPIRLALAGISPLAESMLAKVSLVVAKAAVDLVGGSTLSEVVAYGVIGEVLDGVYAKSIGDIIAAPASEASVALIEEEVEKLSRGRVVETGSISIGEGTSLFTADMKANLRVEYDPLTRNLTGVIVSDCAPKGIMFFYRVEPSTGYMAKATQVWDGHVHFIDLATGDPLP